jgi:hypothetical protein
VSRRRPSAARRRRVAAAVPLLAIAALPGAAPARAAAPGVLVEGDSLAEGTAPYLPDRLPGWRVRSSTTVGLHADQAAAALGAARRLPAVLALSAGTNDDPRNVDAFARAVDRVLALAGPRRCVVWASIVRPPVAGAGYRRMNRVLRRRAGERLVVADWTGLVGRHPEWLAGDGVHVGATGYRARARLMARAIERCGRRLAAA